MTATIEQKLLILQQIYDRKNILFAKFDEKVTADNKQKNWQHVKDFIDSLGVTMINKQWDYVCDAWWPNIKRATILKIDKFRKTSAEGGVEAKLMELDNAVLDIIGKDSAVINGLIVSESTFTPKSCTNSSTVLSTNEELTQVNQTSPKRIQ
uniref:Regulatory protein zeste n=1 Tax=Romanomermis culicivorax TaxID=13658 RepID=A0A915IA99_ROMCU